MDTWLSQSASLPGTAVASLNEFNKALFEKVTKMHFTGLSLGLFQYLHISHKSQLVTENVIIKCLFWQLGI